MQVSYQDESQIAGQRKGPPPRSSTKKNLQNRVEIKPPGKRGPRATSTKRQISMRIEPSTIDALNQIEADLRTDREGVMRALISAYSHAQGGEPVAPISIPQADQIAGRSEVLHVPAKPPVKEFIERGARANNCTAAHLIERAVGTLAAGQDAIEEVKALRARIAELEAA